MLIFSPVVHTCYRRAGVGLLLAQFFLFVFALPPLQSGIWLQTEQVVSALFFFGALNALWCLYGLISGLLRPIRPHLLWWVIVSWVLWQIPVTMLATSPWRSWFGPPELGEGAGWYLALLLLMMVMHPLWQVKHYRQTILYTAAASLLIQALLHLLYPLNTVGRYIPNSWRPASWAAYLAFMAGYMWIAFMMEKGSRRTRTLWLSAVLLGIIVGLSYNCSAMVLLGLAITITIGAWGLSRFRASRRWLYPTAAWRVLFMANCILPLTWILFSAHFSTFEPYTSHTYPLTILSDRDSSMGSRVYLNQMSVEALKAEPVRWLVGAGWGSFCDVVLRYALLNNVSAFSNGVRKPTNAMVDGYSFHSHNQPLEALLALGLPGMLLWLAVPILALWRLPRRFFWPVAPMVVGVVALSNVWFELAQCLPYKALALAALCARKDDCVPEAAKTTIYKILFACAALLMALSTWQQNKTVRYEMQLRDAAHALPYDDYSLGWMESDFVRGGDRFRNSALFYASWLSLKMRDGGLDRNDAHWYARFLEASEDAQNSPKIGPSVASLDLRLKNIMLVNLTDPALDGIRQQVADSMPDTILQLAAQAPLRDDVAALFLVNLANVMPDATDRIAYLHQLLTIAPNHRGALWVLGGMLGGSEGDAMRRRAVTLGVQHVYPVRDEELTAYK